MKETHKKIKGFFAEFRAFAVKGNALDLAIAVVVGNAFSAIVNSLVSDIVTPLLGLLTGNGTTDVKNLSLTLHPVLPGENAQPLLLHYGAFIQTIINFLIISLSVFLVFKVITRAKRRILKEEEAGILAPETPAQERLLEEIRDLLKK